MTHPAHGYRMSDTSPGVALYQSLRINGPAVPAKVAASLGLTDEEAAEGWAELRQLGLLRPGEQPEVVAPVEPDTALIKLLTRQRDDLHDQYAKLSSVISAAESLVDTYRPAVMRDASEVEVEIVTRDARGQQFIRDFLAGIMTTVGSIHPGPLPASEVLVGSLATDAAMINRGVQVRSIYGQSVNSGPRQRKYLSELSSLGAQVRLAQQVPFDLVVGDDHSALIAADPENFSGPAVIVRGPILVRSYLALFEDCWLRAAPYDPHATRAEAGGELTDQHRTTLRLLANGLTDERIARKLGVSLRTVSRLVSEIMRYLDADSRFQAGVMAASQGLL